MADYYTNRQFIPESVRTPDGFAKQLNPAYDPTSTDKNAKQNALLEVDSRYSEFGKTDPEGQKRLSRDYADQLLSQSDVICDTYMRRLKGRESILTYWLNFGGQAFTNLGGLATPPRSAKLLSTVGALSAYGASSIGHDVFDEKHFDVIYNGNRAGRAGERARLRARIDAGEFDGASLSKIRGVMDAYTRECGISYGLSILSEAVNGKPPGSDKTTTTEAPLGAYDGDALGSYADIEKMRAHAITCVEEAIAKAKGVGDDLKKAIAINGGQVSLGSCNVKSPGAWQDTLLNTAVSQLNTDIDRKDSTIADSWKNSKATAPDDVKTAVAAVADQLTARRDAAFVRMRADVVGKGKAADLTASLKAYDPAGADPMLTIVAEFVALSAQQRPDDPAAALAQAKEARKVYLNSWTS